MNELLKDAQTIGLIADIAGAVFISKSVFYKKNQDIFDMSGGFLGYSAKHTCDAIIAKREAILGSIYLILGFIGQIIGSQHNDLRPTSSKLIIIFVVIVIATGISGWIVINKWSRKTTEKLVKKRNL